MPRTPCTAQLRQSAQADRVAKISRLARSHALRADIPRPDLSHAGDVSYRGDVSYSGDVLSYRGDVLSCRGDLSYREDVLSYRDVTYEGGVSHREGHTGDMPRRGDREDLLHRGAEGAQRDRGAVVEVERTSGEREVVSVLDKISRELSLQNQQVCGLGY